MTSTELYATRRSEGERRSQRGGSYFENASCLWGVSRYRFGGAVYVSLRVLGCTRGACVRVCFRVCVATVYICLPLSFTLTNLPKKVGMWTDVHIPTRRTNSPSTSHKNRIGLTVFHCMFNTLV